MLNLKANQNEFEDKVAKTAEEIVKTVAKRDPLDPAPLLELFDDFKGKILDMETEVKAVKVVDDHTSAQASEMAAQAQKLSNSIAKKQKDVTAPYHNVKSTIDGLCKGLKDMLANVKRSAEAKNRTYLIEQDRKRREAEEKARAEAEAKRREAEEKARAEAEAKAKKFGVLVEEVPPEPVTVEPVYIPPAQTKVETESGTQKVEYEMQWEIADFRQLPDECLTARAEQIKSAVAPWVNAKKKAEIFNIPGVVFTKTPILKTRAAR